MTPPVISSKTDPNQAEISKIRPIFILGHPGIDPASLDALAQAVTQAGNIAGNMADNTANSGVFLRAGRDDTVLSLAQTWSTLQGFGPLQGHRDGGASLAPTHPWFGAERTNPDGLRDRLAACVLSHVIDAPPDTHMPILVTSHIFWKPEDCLALARFLLGGLPTARLVLPFCDRARARTCFAARSGWRVEASENAIAQMEDHYQMLTDQLGADYPKRVLTWSLPADPARPPDADLVAALTSKADDT